MAGQPPQASSVSTRASVPSPHQAAISPWWRSTGTSVPDAAMPNPTPVKITPLARPRRRCDTCGSTAGAASTIRTPPDSPAEQPPEEEPGEGNGGRAGEEARGGEQHHRAKRSVRESGPQAGAPERSGEIAGEIGGSEIGDDGGGKPVSADDGRQQRRVGKTCQADADQGGAGTGQGRPPLVHAALWRHHWWGRWVRTDRVGMNCLESRYRSGRLRG